MNTKELLALLDQTLLEMGVAADGVYKGKQSFKKNPQGIRFRIRAAAARTEDLIRRTQSLLEVKT